MDMCSAFLDELELTESSLRSHEPSASSISDSGSLSPPPPSGEVKTKPLPDIGHPTPRTGKRIDSPHITAPDILPDSDYDDDDDDDSDLSSAIDDNEANDAADDGAESVDDSQAGLDNGEMEQDSVDDDSDGLDEERMRREKEEDDKDIKDHPDPQAYAQRRHWRTEKRKREEEQRIKEEDERFARANAVMAEVEREVRERIGRRLDEFEDDQDEDGDVTMRALPDLDDGEEAQTDGDMLPAEEAVVTEESTEGVELPESETPAEQEDRSLAGGEEQAEDQDQDQEREQEPELDDGQGEQEEQEEDTPGK